MLTKFFKFIDDQKVVLLGIILITFIIVPVFTLAQGPFVPCGGNIIDANGNIIGKQPECSYKHLLELVNKIINWIIMISVPVAAGVFAWAGFKYMTTGISDQKSEAKAMINKVFIGFVVILSAWIIVNTITSALLRGPGDEGEDFRSSVPVEGTNKN
mgnify:CR=1 FL=1